MLIIIIEGYELEGEMEHSCFHKISSQKLVERKYDMGTKMHNEKAETI